MIRDVWGRPIHRAPGFWESRRAPQRPFGAPRGFEPVEPPTRVDTREPAPPPSPPPPAAPPPPPVARVASPTPEESRVDAESLAGARAHFAAAQAEIEASRARLAREASREREADKLRLVTEILPALDDLDRSIAAAHADDGVKPALVEGFELVRARLERVLEGYGLERISAVGERFDPAHHEAIALVEVDDPHQVGAVIDEIERGYRAGGRVLRAARVRVGAPG